MMVSMVYCPSLESRFQIQDKRNIFAFLKKKSTLRNGNLTRIRGSQLTNKKEGFPDDHGQSFNICS